MKKSLSVCLLLISFSIISFAQINHDILYLKNGEVVNGIIDGDSSVSIILNTIHGDIRVFKFEEIDKMEHKEYKYVTFTSAGFIMGSALNVKPTVLSVLTEHNYKINKNISIGGLTGIELINETTIPLGINMKTFLPFTFKTMFINTSVGKSFPIKKPQYLDNYIEPLHAYGGVFCTIEIGYSILLNYRNGFFVSMGYRYNELHYDYDRWGTGIADRNYYYHRLSMRLGIIIN